MSAPARISKKATSLTARLQQLRTGPAAITLPAELRELSMTFAAANRDYGARKFMQHHLPSISYVNQTLKVNITRPERVEQPVMVFKFEDATEKTLGLKMKSQDTILSEMKSLLGLSTAGNATEQGATQAERDKGNKLADASASSTHAVAAKADDAATSAKSKRRQTKLRDPLEGTPAPNEGTEQGVANGTERQ